MRTLKLFVVLSITLDRPDAILSVERDITRIKKIIKKT